VVPAPSAVGVVSRGRPASRATLQVAAATTVEARGAVTEAGPALSRTVTTSLSDETRYLAGEIANRLYELRIVRTGIDARNRGW
jgi:hypothetical protein